MSNNNAVPTTPNTGNGFSDQRPVMKGWPKNIGIIPAENETNSPTGMNVMGGYFNKIFVWSKP